jgi:WD40 repeat protein/tRNA A-37 threonylcarbamoyl transferase component Bud32
MSARDDAFLEPDSAEDDELVRLLEACLVDIEAGRAVDLDRLSKEHPAVAGRLRACLAGLQAVNQERATMAGAVAAAAPQPARRQLGDYVLLREIGRGGMGIVYEAEQVSLRRRVAVKVLSFASTLDARLLQRFQTEARAAAALRHPHIVPVYAVGCEEGVHFYVMQYIEGRNLAALIQPEQASLQAGAPPPSAPPGQGRPVEARLAAELGVQAAEALEHAHRQGVVHRDIKPANLLLDERGQVWVTDFGLALLHQEARLTKTGDIVGTLHYMAPEQTAGRAPVDHRADLYALGATLYELLTARPPFDAPLQAELLQQILEAEPRPARQLNRAVPADLETVVLKCLAKRAEQRYATAQELADDLRRFRAGEPIRARRVGSGERLVRWCRRKPVVAGLLAALVLVFLTGFASVLWQWQVALQAAHEERLERRNKEVALEQATTNLYFHQVALADREWTDNNAGYAGQLLDECPADRRHWEWYYLDGLRRSALTTQHDATEADYVRTVWRADGTCVGLSYQEGRVHLWNAATGQELGAVNAIGRWHGVVTMDQERSRLARPSDPGAEEVPVVLTGEAIDRQRYQPTLWEAATGARLTDLPALPAGELLVTFSKDGRFMLTTQSPGWELQVRDTSSGRLVSRLKQCMDWHTARDSDYFWSSKVDFSPDGLHVAACVDKAVRIWEVATGAVVQMFAPPQSMRFNHVRYRPDGQQLAAASYDMTVTLWDVASGSAAHVLRGHSASITSVDYSADGRYLATGSSDRSVRIWEVESGLALVTLRGHADPVAQVRFSPNGERLASVGRDGTVKLWKALEPQEAVTLSNRDVRVFTALAFSPLSSSSLLSGDRDAAVQLWDTATKHGRIVANTAKAPVYAIAFAPDGQHFAAAGDDSWIAIHEAADGKRIQVLQGHTQPVLQLAFHPRLPILASGGKDKTVKLWDLQTGRVIRTFVESTDDVRGLAFSPEGRQLAVGSWDGLVRIYDWESSRVEQTLAGHSGGVTAVAFHPNGRHLASASIDKTVRIWDLGSGRALHLLAGHAGGTTGVAFSPDGRRLASSSHDTTVKLWDTSTGRLALTLRGHRGPVLAVAFGPDGGQTLASASMDHTIRLWRAPRPAP